MRAEMTTYESPRNNIELLRHDGFPRGLFTFTGTRAAGLIVLAGIGSEDATNGAQCAGVQELNWEIKSYERANIHRIREWEA